MPAAKPAPKKEETKRSKTSGSRSMHQQQNQQSQRRNVRKNTKKKKASMQCTRLKAKNFHGHAQHASGVDQATSWETTMTGSLVDTAALHVTSQSK